MNKWDLFQSKRTIPEHHKIISCYAAFNHMRIRRNGGMHPCCFSRKMKIWKKDRFGLKDYWFGELNNTYKDDFLENKLSAGCKAACQTRIDRGETPPIIEYDYNVGEDRLEHALDGNSWPRVFEFEISNLCNMACPMCFGELSSKHMLGRDKDIKQYDPNVFDNDENLEQLLEQFIEFIPHLHEIRFVGGEPFSHKALYKLCALIADINPSLKIQVCTNGSVFNKKVVRICQENNLNLSISLDTVVESEYDMIRIGGKYSETMDNIQKFKDVLGPNRIKVNSTLMKVNAENIDLFLKYAEDNHFGAFINAYDRAGRTHTEDWNINLLSKDVLEDTMNRVQALNISNRNSKMAVTKIMNLLRNANNDR
jgi:molybdenum cofactor biosynthesis enzyme MoaA